MVQQIIRVTSEKNSSGDRMVMPRDHDQHRVGDPLIKSVGLETVSLAITRKKDFSRISNPSVLIFQRIILPSKKQKLKSLIV